jgi:hypothetical protein
MSTKISMSIQKNTIIAGTSPDNFIKQNGKKKRFLNPSYCLFEDHVFDTKAKKWVPIDTTQGLRPCRHSKCTRKHKLTNRPVEVCKNETDCPNVGITCFLLHDNTKIKPLCYYGKLCADLDCIDFRHPSGRATEVCELGEKCDEALLSCHKLHPLSKMIPLCNYRESCKNFICAKRHGKNRLDPCPEGSVCYAFISEGSKGCGLLHPKILQKICRWDDSEYGCRSYGCPYVHSPDSIIDCPDGLQCQKRLINGDEKCINKHPLAGGNSRLY